MCSLYAVFKVLKNKTKEKMVSIKMCFIAYICHLMPYPLNFVEP